MMKRIVQIVFVAMTTACLSGCATVVVRTDISGREPKGLYPATQADVMGTYRYLRNDFDPFGGWRGAGSSHRPNVIEKALWVVFATVDLPISLVMDTLCLPWDIAEKRKAKEVPPMGSSGQ
ncbi:MAG: YceK/YidQ family lipoprotein [Kiritimatiellae bacterium]|nr:YceK/YidQ family lipoprotein [Kiritimatiellia bacterium]MCO5061977.1 YceK/YidQ family lipoprotein [Kiritimatiellia bacterium]MCO5069063.1 YceK/YidQ family lipoprotein [Kiritimatiellia bacterium]